MMTAPCNCKPDPECLRCGGVGRLNVLETMSVEYRGADCTVVILDTLDNNPIAHVTGTMYRTHLSRIDLARVRAKALERWWCSFVPDFRGEPWPPKRGPIGG